MLKLKRYREVIFTSVLDFLILMSAWYLFHSFYSGELNIVLRFFDSNFVTAGLFLSSYWIIVFILAGLYKKLYLVSRLDEFIKVTKATILGGLIIFFATSTETASEFMYQKEAVIWYWGIVFFATTVNRFVIRTIQKAYAIRGKGLHRSVIVGTGATAKLAYDDLIRNKILGMQVLGFVQVNGKAPDEASGIKDSDVLGHLDDIERIIEEQQVQDILVAIEPERKKDLVQVISKIDYPEISLKILPDFYQLVNGLNKTNQIFGLPIIEISPEPMPLWESAVKRMFDFVVSVFILVVFLPVWLIVGLMVRLSSKGPAIFKQRRVGKNGKEFVMYKYRTMYEDAEARTGPMWAQQNDPRITKMGYWLRKLRIDEVPQLMNVLKGEMSLVGPRPERQHFVDQFKSQIPLYTRRLRVRPGITGWAQVKWKYDSSLDDVKEKTKYDLFYVENMSLKMDAKILINTIFTVVKGKGQ